MTFTEHLARGRDLARTAGDHAADMFSPLITIGRGLGPTPAGRRTGGAAPRRRSAARACSSSSPSGPEWHCSPTARCWRCSP
ncbi:hypothetical protein ACFQZC_05790 [Streptacidiphilus monticola]